MKHLVILLAILAWFAPVAFSQTAGQIVLQKKNAGAGYSLQIVTPAANGLLAFDGSADPTVVTSLAQSVITNLTTDLGNKQPLDADLTAIAALTTTSYGRSTLALSDSSAARTYFGLGTVATLNTGSGSGQVPVLGIGGVLSLAGAVEAQNAVSVFAASPTLVLDPTGSGVATIGVGSLTTTRTYTLPDKSGVFAMVADAGGLVDVSDEITGTLAVSNGGTGQTTAANATQAFLDSISTTQGTILYNNGTDWVSLAPGTSGHFLKTNGAGANPQWAAASGGGQLSEWAFVDPANGNDTTGNGTAGSPWATIQKAITEGKDFIFLAPGNAGNISLSATRYLVIQGAGRDVSTIGSVSITGGATVTIADGGFQSFTCSGNITTTNATPGGSTGSLNLYCLYGPSILISSLGANGSTGQAGGGIGPVTIEQCYFSEVSTLGGTGGDGDGSNPSGDGGAGGNVALRESRITGNITTTGGNAGTDNGGGSGNPGDNGTVTSRFNDIGGSISTGTPDIHATLQGGTWID
jgi:hypothetical protein